MVFLDKIFGDTNKKYLKKLQPLVDRINDLEKDFESLSDEKLKEKTAEFRERLKRGESLNDLLPEAFALVRKAAKRTLSQRHYDCQLMGGIALHQGKIVQMLTGEGKTLTATLPLYLNALSGKGCHLVTVNDYLARRDTVWMGQIYHTLGLSVGCLNHEQSFLYDPDYKRPDEEKDKVRDELGGFRVVEDFLGLCKRSEAYEADITYGTNHEFGFDYLRDNMVYDFKNQVQRGVPEERSSLSETEWGFNFAIVDEIDFLLIDEARTPLIISAPDEKSSVWYKEFAKIIPKLDLEEDYEIDEKMRVVTLTEKGISKIERILGMKNIYTERGIRYLHHLEQALRAQAQDSTGHALFERDRDYIVKDGRVIIVDEFTGRLMPGRRWSGSLHQAIEAKEGVQIQPESLTLATITFQNFFRLYKKLAGMTGTAQSAAEEFDKVYNLEVICIPTNKPMIRKNLPDRFYKTKNGKLKAVVGEIKKRCQKGQPVLVGTRSVEKNEYLGNLLEREGIPHQILNAKHHEKEAQIIAQAGKLKAITIATNMAGRGVDIILGGNPQNPEEAKKIIELEGLHVIATERHEARRIDNQLRGRAGRQGDPGSSQFFVSLEDDLLRIFGGDRMKSFMEMLKIPEDEPIESKLVSNAIEEAQKRVEGFHFDARSHLLEYDNVMNKHREIFYKKRRKFLTVSLSELKEEILEIIKKAGYSLQDFEKKEKEVGFEKFFKAIRFLSLRIFDSSWINHLDEMASLRDKVKLRAYGQLDPLIEYKNESYKMFQGLLLTIESAIAQTIFRIKTVKEQIKTNSSIPTSMTQIPRPSESRYKKGKKKVGRNDPCPCGARKPDGRPIKFKHCHGRNV